ncbi:helix-turn-helix domain-containing protein [Mesobacillus subterraneus]|uniref:helix-turn-helix domain-containing protein n=1 Tax=Mesobacillus subterraneus TaxID=285983 RepID=UPI00203E73C7|nr:helix-turn-helix transcriptional regulator [Mesobacillus subterraneus]MCM3572285.1 helix-turn-helix domain-containing protein [Mesobacillus subterraneus]
MEEKQTIKFGHKLKMLRKKHLLSQEDLAELSKLDRKYISNLERDVSSPTLDTLYKLAAAFGISFLELGQEINEVEENQSYLISATKEVGEIKAMQKNKKQ